MLSRRGGFSSRAFSLNVDAKVVAHGQSARSQILSGCNTLADAVGATLGPRGRNVILEQSYGGPKITKDGVTVAKCIDLEDPLQQLGASLIKQVAQSANDASGDGTTTATILAREIYKGGCEAVAAGLKPMEIVAGIKEASQAVLKFLEDNSRSVKSAEDLYHVAKVSANGDDKIGRLIASAIDKVGKEGVVTVTEGKSVNHDVKFTDGYEIDRGYVSPYLITDSKTSRCVLNENPLILISEDKLSNLKNLLPALEYCAEKGKELLIIADDFESEVLSTLVLNKLRGGLKVCAVKAPSFGDYKKMTLSDIAVLTGATVLSKERGFETATTQCLGQLDKAVIGKEKCLIMSGEKKPRALETHLATIRNAIDDSSTSDYERNKLRERIAKLTSGVAVIHIGGNSEVEVAELKDRVDDALNATRAALTGGVLPGGGSALLFGARAALTHDKSWSKDKSAGFDIVRRACEAPIRQIAENAGYEGAVVVGDLVREGKFGRGFDALSGRVEDMYQKGIIDPTTVVTTALRDASSVASLMCTTEAAVYKMPSSKSRDRNEGFPGAADM